MDYPTVSFCIPTLNSISVLEKCLISINAQDYPKNKIEIIVGDGGSTDGTLELAKKYNVMVVHNALKTGESGKKVALDASSGDFIAFVDSDNFLPTSNWLKQMIEPLLINPEYIGSEPWEYTWRKEDGFITRYSALLGMNDPFVHFLGNYDRLNGITGKWTEVIHKEEDKGDYILAIFDKQGLPTIGANGTVFRAAFLKSNVKGAYLFDIDILSAEIKSKGFVKFIKVKNGIIHSFCESSIAKFDRKQKRRVKDFLYHKFVAKDRNFEWEAKDVTGKGVVTGNGAVAQTFGLFTSAVLNNKGMLEFLLSCVLVFPLFYQAFKGYSRKPDMAWLFHPLACEITLWEYAFGTISGLAKREEISRKNWGQ